MKGKMDKELRTFVWSSQKAHFPAEEEQGQTLGWSERESSCYLRRLAIQRCFGEREREREELWEATGTQTTMLRGLN